MKMADEGGEEPLSETGDRDSDAVRAAERAAAYTKAVSLLARREHSSDELARKLQARGIASEVAMGVVADLTARDYQSDARYADMLVRTRIADGCGPLRIAADLRHAGIDAATGAQATTSALENQAVEWRDVARRVLERRGFEGPLDTGRQRKAFALLQRRGFEGETIRNLLRETPTDGGHC